MEVVPGRIITVQARIGEPARVALPVPLTTPDGFVLRDFEILIEAMPPS